MNAGRKLASKGSSKPPHFRERSSCPLCDSSRDELLLNEPYSVGPIYDYVKAYYSNKGLFEEEYLAEANYVVTECLGCGLVYQKWVPDPIFLERLYGTWIDPIAAAKRNKIALGSNAKQYVQEQLLLRSWANGKKLRVLDFGMGHGRWCEMAVAFGHDCCGHEFESERVRQSSDRGQIECIDFLEIGNRQFDFINSEQVFEHLAEPVRVLEHLVKALPIGGLIRIGVPSGRKIKRNLQRGLDFSKRSKYSLNPIEPLQHLNCFTPTTLTKLGERVGLKQHLFPISQVIASKVDWSMPTTYMRNLIHPIYNRLRYRDGMAQYFLKV